MRKIYKSLKDAPINGYIIIVVMALYCINRFYLKQHTTGWINYLLRCHFNDTICGTLFVAYSNVFLNTRKQAFVRLIMIIPFCFCAGLVWEFIAPLIRKDSTSDWIDVGCYVLGGLIYWFVYRLGFNINKKRKIIND